MAYQTIPAGQLAAYAPVTGRLAEQLRENTHAARVHTLVFPYNWTVSGSTTTTSGAWTTIATIRLFVPDSLIGSNGVKLTLELAINNSNTDAGSQHRLKIGTDEGTAIAVGTGGSTTLPASVTATPTGDAVADVLLQINHSGDGLAQTVCNRLNYGLLELEQ